MQPRLLHHPLRLAGASLLSVQSDARLVALAREGHEPGFAAIVDRYRAPLTRYCTRLLGPGRAEDAVQQAFVNAHHAMRTTEADIKLRPWLYRIAHNAALNLMRATRQEEPLDAERPAGRETLEEVELRDRLHETLSAIQALPSAQRDAILLRELEGRSHAEIGAALGVTAGAARQYLMRARATLRAGATAITPQPLLMKLTAVMAADPASGRVAEAFAGAGATAMVAKVSAGMLATGALVGGIATAPERSASHHRLPEARSATATSSRRAADPAAVVAPAAALRGRRGTTTGRRAHDGRGEGPEHGYSGRDTSGHRGESGAAETGDDHGGSSGTSEHSGSPRPDGDDHGDTSDGGGSTTSGSGSGTSSSGTSGSDDVPTTQLVTSGDGGGTSGSSDGSDSGTSGGSGTSSDSFLSSGSGATSGRSGSGTSGGDGSDDPIAVPTVAP